MSQSARAAEALGAHLPPLLVAAERVASTVAQGVHGRRRVGRGDSFWQYRPFLPGDAVGRIDWRQSARSDRLFIRETEWEAAQTVCVWHDTGASMRWRSRGMAVDKHDRAALLALALAALLLRGGERVVLLRDDAAPGRPVAGRAGLERLAERIARAVADDAGLPPAAARVPAHANVVLIGDFLAPLADIQARVARIAGTPARGTLLQVLDPAEADLPYQGRVRFEGVRAGDWTLVPRVEGIRDAYARRLAEQQQGLTEIAAAAGWSFLIHRTDHSPEGALLALFSALAPAAGRFGATRR